LNLIKYFQDLQIYRFRYHFRDKKSKKDNRNLLL